MRLKNYKFFFKFFIQNSQMMIEEIVVTNNDLVYTKIIPDKLKNVWVDIFKLAALFIWSR